MTQIPRNLDRMDRRRFLTVTGSVSSALVLGPVLAACGSDEEGTARSLSGKLDMTTDFDYAGKPGGMGKYWDALTKSFESDTDVSVDALLTPYQELQPRMEAQFQAQESPELLAYFPSIHAFQFVDRGALEPLNEVLPDEEVDNWLFAGYPIDGNFYMSPTYIELFELVANRELAESGGINLDERIPSWEDFVAGLETIKADGAPPVMLGTKDQFGIEQWAIPMSMANMDDGTEWGGWITGDLPYETPAGSGWVDQIAELFEKGLVNEDAAELNAAEAVKRFQNGEGAFMVMFSGEALALDPDQYQIIPYWDGPGEASAPVAAAGSGIVMSTYGENKDAATEMLEFQHSPKMLEMLFDLAGVLPNDKRYQPDVEDNPLMAQTYDLINGEPKPHWPTEFMVQEVLFDGMYAFGPKLAAGASPDEVHDDLRSFLEDWRDTTPERQELTHNFVESTGAS